MIYGTFINILLCTNVFQTGFREGSCGFLGVPLIIIIFSCSDHTFPYLNIVQAPFRIWNMQIARHTHILTFTLIHSPVCWRIWMNNYHDMQTHKSREHKTKFHYICLGFWFTTPLGRRPTTSSTVLPLLNPLPHIWVHIFGPWPNRVHRCRHSSPTEAIPTDAESERPTEPMGVSGIVCLFSFSHNYEKTVRKNPTTKC